MSLVNNRNQECSERKELQQKERQAGNAKDR